MMCVWPLPPHEQANRVDAAFLDPNYPAARRKMGLSPDEHPGVDINLTGTGGNADLGYPVVAILPGEVVHAKQHRVWGNVVLIRHYPHVAAHFGYPTLYSQYAHLHHICVREGMHLLPGEPVGSIGRGDPLRPFAAHLHFELRIDDLPADHWPTTRDNILRSYIDPVRFLKKHASYERRYFFPRTTIYTPNDPPIRVYGPSRLNLQEPDHLKVGLPDDIL
ncbi:MAG: M23 family metallopeptidase [Anaerolineae bacterium]|nr:M23 family metallopeptidase [Anaerolineae bacterium]